MTNDLPVITHWIGDAPYDGAPERYSHVHDPATGAVTAVVNHAGVADVDHAVALAVAAAERWGRSSLSTRSRVLFAFRDLVQRHRDELAALITAEHGKVLDDALGEVTRGLEVVEFACGMPHLLKGEFAGEVSTGVDSYSIRQPLGVVGVISPFNFPVMVPMWFFPLAVAAGNAVVLKPSERDPSASVRIAELWQQAGLPTGVFTVVHGSATAVNRLLTHPDVAAISFVGSTPVAEHVYRTASQAGKRVQALGGAKNHMVVMPDADVELAADAAVSAAYGSAGERCMAISAVVAVGSVADPLVAAIRSRIATLRVGDGRSSVDMGPLISAEHRDRVAGYLDMGVKDGAELVVDGRTTEVHGADDGFWLGPSLLDRVPVTSPAYTDEIFGPVLSVVRVASFDEALALVNASPYGNGTAIFTQDGSLARTYQSEVQAGMVGINVAIPVPMAYFSFGGWKNSLFGDLHAHGKDGVAFFTRGKVITSRWPEPAQRGLVLGFPQNS